MRVRLTKRQSELLRLVIQYGMTNRRIAKKMGLANSSVNAHLKKIYAKFGISDDEVSRCRGKVALMELFGHLEVNIRWVRHKGMNT